MNKMNCQIKELKKIIDAAQKILILTHQSPDGDAVGSSLALYSALKNNQKDVDTIIIDYPDIFQFLPETSNILTTSNKDYDLIITVDCSDIKRVAQDKNYYSEKTLILNIDHHPTNNFFGDYNYVDADAPATTQILYRLFKDLNLNLTKEIGECLTAGLVTDTGGFKHSNVNAETFLMAADLINKNVNISDIYVKVLQTKTRPQFELTNLATSRLELFFNDQVAFTYINLEDEKKFEAKTGDHEGIVDIGRALEGIEVSIFLHQSESGYKVSLRSNNYVNVAEVSQAFGGGGHLKAAGCLIELPLDKAKDAILKEVEKQL